jgi:hypothetical protein
MRNKIPFGYTLFGGQTLVKLNVKLSDQQASDLVKKHPGLTAWNNGRYGIAIDGIIKNDTINAFHKDLQLARIDAKIERLMEDKVKLLDASFTDPDLPNFDLI